MYKISFIFALIALPLISYSDGTDKQHDLAIFKKNAELCEHFAGEWDPDLPANDKKNIEKNVDKFCALAKRQRLALIKKFQSDSNALKLLDEYESVVTFAK